MRKINVKWNEVVLVVVSMIFGLSLGSWSMTSKCLKYTETIKECDSIIDAGVDYYIATEALLDTLEKYDNWVDRFDPQKYYETRENFGKSFD